MIKLKKTSTFFDVHLLMALIIMIMWLFLTVSWIKNIYELTECDFESPYKCEVIHGIGIPIPPVSWISAWVDFGK